MTNPDQKQLDDLAKTTMIVFSMLGDESYFSAQTHADNPEIGPGEIVILTITRKHSQPPQHPLMGERLVKVPELVMG